MPSAFRSATLAILAVATLFALESRAASRGVQAVAVTDRAGERVALYKESHALVIGVSEYATGWPRLPGVRKDVDLVRAALEGRGFAVTVVLDPDRRGLDDAFRDFIARHGQEPDNRLLFYFAGHGHSLRAGYGGRMGYLVARDTPRPDHDAAGFKSGAMSMQTIETYARNIDSKHALFVFDACFSGTVFEATRALPEAITRKIGQPVRQFITSGTAEQAVPDESVFRGQFVAALAGEADLDRDGFLTGGELGQFLEDTVTNYTRGAQTPRHGKLRDPLLDKGDFVFALGAPAPAPSAPASRPGGAEAVAMELAFWNSIKDSADPAHHQAYLKRYPDGAFAELARLRLARPADAAPAAAPHAAGGSGAAALEGAWIGPDTVVILDGGRLSVFMNGRYAPDEEGGYRVDGEWIVAKGKNGEERVHYSLPTTDTLEIDDGGELYTLTRIGPRNEGLEQALRGRWVPDGARPGTSAVFDGDRVRLRAPGAAEKEARFRIYGNDLFIWTDDEDTHVGIALSGGTLRVTPMTSGAATIVFRKVP